jgi:hypothetical protein
LLVLSIEKKIEVGRERWHKEFFRGRGHGRREFEHTDRRRAAAAIAATIQRGAFSGTAYRTGAATAGAASATVAAARERPSTVCAAADRASTAGTVKSPP